jgi:hypothetical protein
MLALLTTCLLLPVAPQDTQPSPLETTAERSNWTRTSLHADVVAFVNAAATRSNGRVTVETIGQTAQQRPLVLATLRSPTSTPTLRALIVANIHAGEVEGKEVAQQLVRSAALGELDDLLTHVELLVVPDFNPDGNDRIDRKNRVSQNGPDEGVGRRENSNGLDLNRDFVKLESEEAQALLSVMRARDPQVLLDLHTTNGSHHGYHLTYAPSLAVNMEPGLSALNRRLVEQVRDALQKDHGTRAFDYGNFSGRGEERRWTTFDHRPRFLTNYYGLRNRLAFLCEAYSYLPFQRRAEVTRQFVLATLRAVAGAREEIVKACAAAEGKPPGAVAFASELVPPVEREVLTGSVERVVIEGLGTRLVAKDEYAAVRMPVQNAFRGTKTVPAPKSWAILRCGEATKQALQRHGIAFTALADRKEVDGEEFTVTGDERARSSFQRHLTVTLKGEWRKLRLELPSGTVIVSGEQPLARLVAQLLEPLSEDSLATWNHFEDGQTPFPVVKL